MKSYTDLEQSKKLTEILPLESADMYYCYGMDILTKVWSFDNTPTIIDNSNQIDVHADIPCWSLSALMNVLPYPSLAQHANGLWRLVAWVDKVEAYSVGDSVCGYDNQIDACVAMIEKLHELKML